MPRTNRIKYFLLLFIVFIVYRLIQHKGFRKVYQFYIDDSTQTLLKPVWQNPANTPDVSKNFNDTLAFTNLQHSVFTDKRNGSMAGHKRTFSNIWTGNPSNSKVDKVKRCSNGVRMAALEEYCKTSGQTKLDYNNIEAALYGYITYFMVVDDKHETIYCDIPKSGSSTWMSFIIQENMNRYNKSIDWDKYPIHDPSFQQYVGINHLPGYNLSEIRYRLDHYFKFMVTRHPLERLVSAYNDKFLKTEFGYREYYRPYIIDHFRKGRTDKPMSYYRLRDAAIGKYIRHVNTMIPEEFLEKGENKDDAVKAFMRYHKPMKRGTEYTASFSEFLQFVLNVTAELEHDQHWMSMLEITRPCLFKYDYIGKLETLDDDSQEIIKYMDLRSPIQHDHKVQHVRHYRKDNDKTQVNRNALSLKTIKEFSEINQDLIDKILQMYKGDFLAFGYSWNMEQLTSSCNLEWNKEICC